MNKSPLFDPHLRDMNNRLYVDFYWYLATPYDAHKEGHGNAYLDAKRATSKLIEHGVLVFSPIVHMHPLLEFSKPLQRQDAAFWMSLCRPIMREAGGLIIPMIPGWSDSAGIKEEYEFFSKKKLPVVFTSWPLTDIGTQVLKADILEKENTKLQEEYFFGHLQDNAG